ncbi:MAG: hypothetical protein H6834_12455 [Planctomycetes bacterium]|nr:hypothetical protein [Planctomycetota bacterium]
MKRVREILTKLDGVDDVAIDFAAKTARVRMAKGKTMDQKIIEKAFDGGRYGVTKFETVVQHPEKTYVATLTGMM